MAAPRPALRADVALRACDDLGFLIRRRHQMDDDPLVPGTAVLDLDERIASRLDVMRVAGFASVAAHIEDPDVDTDLVLGALAALLTTGAPTAWRARLPIDLWLPLSHHFGLQTGPERAAELLRLCTEPDGRCWWPAVGVIAKHRPGVVQGQIAGGLADSEPIVRRLAWIAAASCPAAVTDQRVAAGLADSDRLVVRACAESLVWLKHPALERHLRTAVPGNVKPNELEVILIGARIAQPDLSSHLLTVCQDRGLGARRFDVLAALGSPAGVPIVMDGLRDPAPTIARSAATAFSRLLGAVIDSDQRISTPSPQDHDPETDEEFAEDGWAPDATAAASIWQSQVDRLSTAERIAGGHPIDDVAMTLDQAPSAFEWRSRLMRRSLSVVAEPAGNPPG